MYITHLRKGFTIIELMIVIAIIGVLAASLFPALTGYLSRARDTKKVAEIKDLNTALTLYNADYNTYLVLGTGYNGGGAGWVNYTDAGTGYPKSIFTGLQEKGYFTLNVKQKIVDDVRIPEIIKNSGGCGIAYVSQDLYMFHFDDTTKQYAIAGYLENPKQVDTDNAMQSYNGSGTYGTCTYYGMNYAVGQN